VYVVASYRPACIQLQIPNAISLTLLCIAQAQLAVNHPNEALSSALKAYEYCTKATSQTTFSNAALISQHVLKCKKRKWEIRERERIRRRGNLLSELEETLERSHKAEVDSLTARMESGELSASTAHEEKEELQAEHGKKLNDLRTAFALSDPSAHDVREVPDYLVDGITFEIMHDPVVTNNGRSYERATLIEHLKRSPTDPLTREPLRIAELRPNLALKEACLEFVECNSGWIYDW
jgi:STIP1 family protein 1